MKTALYGACLTLFVCCLGLAACKKKQAGLEAWIPDNALMAYRLSSPEVLLQKADAKGLIANLDAAEAKIKNPLDKANLSKIKALLADPAQTGIELTSPIYGYIGSSNEGATTLIRLKNQGQLETWIAKMMEGDKTWSAIEQKNGFKACTNGAQMFSLAWNENMLLLLEDRGNRNEGTVAAIFQPKENHIGLNAEAAAALARPMDFTAYLALEPLLNQMPPQFLAGLQVAGLSGDAFKGAAILPYAEFGAGFVRGGFDTQFSNELQLFLANFLLPEISSDLAKRLPDNAATAMGLGLNLKGVVESITSRGFAPFVNEALAPYGFQLQELSEGLSGDLLIGLVPGIFPEPIVILGLKNRAFGDRVLGIAEKQIALQGGSNWVNAQRSSERLYLTPKEAKGLALDVRVADNCLIASTNDKLLAASLSGNGSGLAGANALLRNSLFLFMNMDKSADFISLVPGRESKDLAREFKGGIENLSQQLGIKGMGFEVNFKNKTENGLAAWLRLGLNAMPSGSTADFGIFDEDDDED